MVRLGFPRVLSNTPRLQKRWLHHRRQKLRAQKMTSFKAQQSPKRPFKSTRKRLLQTWKQIKHFTAEGIRVVKAKGQQALLQEQINDSITTLGKNLEMEMVSSDQDS